jgi:hypothetical protein
MRLIAVDCDGTVSISSGCVQLQDVLALAQTDRVFVIGNRALAALTGLPNAGALLGLDVSGLEYPGGKTQALADWQAAFPGMDDYIVVDDQPGQYRGGWPGWHFYLPGAFNVMVLGK